jgi:hypothetical protein
LEAVQETAMPLDSKPSAPGGRKPLDRLADRLREMFDTAKARPTPPELLDLVDQLDGGRRPEAGADETPKARHAAFAM